MELSLLLWVVNRRSVLPKNSIYSSLPGAH